MRRLENFLPGGAATSLESCMTTAVSFSSCCPVCGLVFKMGRCLTFCERARLVAKAGAPVSPTRNACPSPLDFLRRRAAVASECNWRSAAELSSGNGSDFVEGAMVGNGWWWWWMGWSVGQPPGWKTLKRKTRGIPSIQRSLLLFLFPSKPQSDPDRLFVCGESDHDKTPKE